MKYWTVGCAILAAAVLVSGCATSYPVGGIVTQVRLPAMIGDGAIPRQGLKRGVAECKSYLAMFATGDASIDTAARGAGITKIHYVDWEAENVLGLIGTYRCIVYGE